MRQTQFLALSTAKKNEFDGTRRRNLLPFGFDDPKEDGGWAAGQRRWTEFSVYDALAFRVYVDLTRGGLRGEEACAFVSNAFGRIGTPDEVVAKVVRPLSLETRDTWIAREAYTADYVDGFEGNSAGFSVTWWAGTRDDIENQISLRRRNEAGEHRETLSVQFYNLSKVGEETWRRTRDLGIEVESEQG